MAKAPAWIIKRAPKKTSAMTPEQLDEFVQRKLQQARDRAKAWAKKDPADAKERHRTNNRAYRERHLERVRKARRERAKARYWANPEKFRAESLARRRANIEKARERDRAAWRKTKKENPDKIREKYKTQYSKPGHAIRVQLSNRLNSLLSACGERKGPRSTMSLVGCTKAQLVKHIESQFTNGMTWENRGKMWHIDHIIPCAAFDHTDPKQVEACWHYTNLRPLFAQDNLRKGGRVTEPQMKLRLPMN